MLAGQRKFLIHAFDSVQALILLDLLSRRYARGSPVDGKFDFIIVNDQTKCAANNTFGILLGN